MHGMASARRFQQGAGHYLLFSAIITGNSNNHRRAWELFGLWVLGAGWLGNPLELWFRSGPVWLMVHLWMG
jgi:hypothetical protein